MNDYLVLEKTGEDGKWYFEGCYNTEYPGDMNAMAQACYNLGHARSGKKIRVLWSRDYVANGTTGYPKDR